MFIKRGQVLSSAVEWVAVDWGTTNLRAWGISARGEVVFTRQSDQGMGRLEPSQYPDTLLTLLAGELPQVGVPIDVLICGMAGARQGWIEAPYVDAPAELTGIGFGAVSPTMTDARLAPRILPGVCQKLAGAEDVMRGEETQLLGLSALVPGFAGTVVMPGTHAKWAELDRSRLLSFESAMSGELFDVLRTHSVLRHSFGGETEGPEREEGFTSGAESGLAAPQKLSALLFKVRAASLLSGKSSAWCAGYLSGLLIGAEIGGHRELLGDTEVMLVGSVALCALYARVLEMAGATSRTIDSTEATLAGLKAARAAG